ncbi:class A beta-lactamase [Roseibium polysiphoniae]|uniref:class A beta-lactamase n=1 Tax=Roseibium polysiphoniae TaxID=2571221 RepID=UPI003297FC41
MRPLKHMTFTQFALPLAATLSIATSAILSVSSYAAGFDPQPIIQQAIEIEKRHDARIGIAVLDDKTGTAWSYKGDVRFPLNSTFKAFACAALLAQVDEGTTDPNKSVQIKRADIAPYSPVTKKQIGKTMTYLGLCNAAVTISDNTAANYILEEIGGPAGLSAFLRKLGDKETRLDRWEPELNNVPAGELRDTTTPLAAATTLKTLLLGGPLSANSRKQLTDWLVANKVGDTLLRAGLPQRWKIGDKTGADAKKSRGDIAVIWPRPDRAVFVAVYLDEAHVDMSRRNAAIAEIGRALTKALAP